MIESQKRHYVRILFIVLFLIAVFWAFSHSAPMVETEEILDPSILYPLDPWEILRDALLKDPEDP